MDWTSIIIAIVSSTAVSSVVQAVVKHIEKKHRAKDAYASGIRIVLYSQLKRDAHEHITEGSISKTEYDAFLEGYNTYKALGGDGYMEKIKKEVEKLPIIIND